MEKLYLVGDIMVKKDRFELIVERVKMRDIEDDDYVLFGNKNCIVRKAYVFYTLLHHHKYVEFNDDDDNKKKFIDLEQPMIRVKIIDHGEPIK